MFQLLKNVTIASGGVMPHIQPELLKHKDGGKFQAPPKSNVDKKAIKPKSSGVTKAKNIQVAKAAKAALSKATPAKSLTPKKVSFILRKVFGKLGKFRG